MRSTRRWRLRVDELVDVNVRACLSLRPRAVLEADPEREHFNFFNWHLGGYDRKHCDAGRQNYIPCNLGEIPDYYRRFIDPPAIMVVKTRPADADGFFNFGAANLWQGAVAARAKVVIVETNPAIPHVHGIENGLHTSQVDYVIEGDGQPVPELPKRAADRRRLRGRRLIAGEIDDGACLQIGIGAMPNAVCSLLLRKRRARPRRPHRDADRRPHRPLPGRSGHGRSEDIAPAARSCAASASGRRACTTRSTTTPTSPASPST